MNYSMYKIIFEKLTQAGLSLKLSNISSIFICFILAIIAAFIIYFIIKKILIKILKGISKRTKTIWDDIFFNRKVFHKLLLIIPGILFYWFVQISFKEQSTLINFSFAIVKIYIIIVSLLTIDAFLNALQDIYQGFKIAKTKTIKGYVQVIKIIFYVIGAIIIIGIILNKSPNALLAGLGALSAVLMLIFKDPILGFVGSIQLSANDMVRPGDWISVKKFEADGIVIDMSLTTVKVQNWDKTITTIPTYSLITDSFQNWRGMEESGGRRIKRSLYIDISTIKFCDNDMLSRFEKIDLIADYIKKNKNNELTNIGVFRYYLKKYLEKDPFIRNDMTFLVRQLQSTEKGLPIEIYVFSNIQQWDKYENIQSDIIDHIMAIIPSFNLKIFQNPSGNDFKNLLDKTLNPRPIVDK